MWGVSEVSTRFSELTSDFVRLVENFPPFTNALKGNVMFPKRLRRGWRGYAVAVIT
jgi:hypothetical protein